MAARGECYLALTREQVFEIVDAPDTLAVGEAVRGEDGHPTLRWSDGHRSRYKAGWLRANANDEESRSDRRRATPDPSLWGSARANDLPTFDYTGVMQDDAILLRWLVAALRLFQRMSRETRFRVERRLAPGDMWVFDNRRVLHARRAFDPLSGRRHLKGVYVDRDELRSRIRVLERAP